VSKFSHLFPNAQRDLHIILSKTESSASASPACHALRDLGVDVVLQGHA